jgi:CBS domain-containing protein
MKVVEHCQPPAVDHGGAERRTPPLLTAEVDDSLAEAAGRMQWHAVGALPVYERHALVGIVTERDVTAAVADGIDPLATPVSAYMTPSPATVRPDDDLVVAVRRMAELGVRHLPVLEEGRLVGMLSMRDLLGLGLAGTVPENQG